MVSPLCLEFVITGYSWGFQTKKQDTRSSGTSWDGSFRTTISTVEKLCDTTKNMVSLGFKWPALHSPWTWDERLLTLSVCRFSPGSAIVRQSRSSATLLPSSVSSESCSLLRITDLEPVRFHTNLVIYTRTPITLGHYLLAALLPPHLSSWANIMSSCFGLQNVLL